MKNGAILLFDLARGEVKETLVRPLYQVQSLALAPDGKTVVWSSADVEEGKQPGELRISRVP